MGVIWEQIKDKVQELIDSNLAGVKADLTTIEERLDDEIDTIQSQIDAVSASVVELERDLTAQINDAILDVRADMSALETTLSGEIVNVETTLRTFVDDSISEIRSNFDAVTETIELSVSNLNTFVTSEIATLQTTITDGLANLQTTFDDSINNLSTTIQADISLINQELDSVSDIVLSPSALVDYLITSIETLW